MPPVKPKTRKRKIGGAKPFEFIYIRTDANLKRVLEQVARARTVGHTVFAEDVIRMYLLATTDPDDPELSGSAKQALKNMTPVPERRNGYRDSLGLDVSEEPIESHLNPSPV